jgi:hypothetical protein
MAKHRSKAEEESTHHRHADELIRRLLSDHKGFEDKVRSRRDDVTHLKSTLMKLASRLKRISPVPAEPSKYVAMNLAKTDIE